MSRRFSPSGWGGMDWDFTPTVEGGNEGGEEQVDVSNLVIMMIRLRKYL